MCLVLGKPKALYLSRAAIKHKNLAESNDRLDSAHFIVDIPFCLILTDLWGGRTYLHLKGVYSSPFLSFRLFNLKVLTISIGSIHAKQSAHHKSRSNLY